MLDPVGRSSPLQRRPFRITMMYGGLISVRTPQASSPGIRRQGQLQAGIRITSGSVEGSIRWVGRVEFGGSVFASRCGDACGPEILVGVFPRCNEISIGGNFVRRVPIPELIHCPQFLFNLDESRFFRSKKICEKRGGWRPVG